jgi:hypothetical protein
MDARLGVFAAKILFIVSSQPVSYYNHDGNALFLIMSEGTTYLIFHHQN